MERRVLIYLLFSFFILLVSWEEEHVNAVAVAHDEVKKEEAIRLRILANSDAIEDQQLKRKIRDAVNIAIRDWVHHLTEAEEAKALIKAKLPEIEEIVAKELMKYGNDDRFNVRLGKSEFPTKVYGNIVYPAATYEAVIITLGEGKGENWWCVLFPPLCFINMDEEGELALSEENDEEPTEVEVSFFIAELFTSVRDRIN